VELLDLGVELVEDGYSVGNTEHDVGTLRFKDFIRMVNFIWLCADRCQILFIRPPLLMFVRLLAALITNILYSF
jgi:hypothetical protein